ncbi:MAG: 7-cyano-7-deazaguanine reductase [Phenylobacterium sp.]|jgi:7-cyano-7-deazaguanine reductase
MKKTDSANTTRTISATTENDPLKRLKDSLLGKNTDYLNQYDPTILYPVPRQMNRDDLGLDPEQPLPFFGEDVWHGYELSWLNAKGKPQVALARFSFPCQSLNIVESKSFKLYLNSYNQSKFHSFDQVELLLEKDLSELVDEEVNVTLFTPDQLDVFTPTALPGICIDDCDITVDDYQFTRQHLNDAITADSANPEQISQTLHSHLLKSNCLITNQPDWASVVISYCGKEISQEALLRYLISFRQHNEFHEQCVERIFNDIWTIIEPQSLTVTAYYTRRGGLDINPWRSSENQPHQLHRTNRQ